MKVDFIDVKYKGKIEISKSALKELAKFERVALYTTTQFIHGIKKVFEQLEKEGIEVVTSQPERTKAKMQILGCDAYHGNLRLPKKVDAFLYVGDGMFHPNALLFQENDSKENKPVFVYNPKTNKMKKYDKKDIDRVLKQKERNLKRFLMAEKVGILVTTKPGQEHFHYVKKLEAKFPKKKFYVFVSDGIDLNEMENFNFVKAWVNTACPRIALEDSLNFESALVNAVDVLRA